MGCTAHSAYLALASGDKNPRPWTLAVHLSFLSHPQLREIPLHLTPIEYGGRNRCSR
jgi:hypothetical protein